MINITYELMYMFYKVFNNRKVGRKLKKEFNHYLDIIFDSLKYAIPWRRVSKNQLHYTTYHKFFKKLMKLNVFEYTY